MWSVVCVATEVDGSAADHCRVWSVGGSAGGQTAGSADTRLPGWIYFRHKHNGTIRSDRAQLDFGHISVLRPKQRPAPLRPVDHRQTKELNSGIAN